MDLTTHLSLIPERVLAGMTQAPGISTEMLRDKINANDLVMKCCHNCIAGQLYADYDIWAERFSITPNEGVYFGVTAVLFWGADQKMDTAAIACYEQALQAEWEKQLKSLQTKPVISVREKTKVLELA